jgi:hypothetical protein
MPRIPSTNNSTIGFKLPEKGEFLRNFSAYFDPDEAIILALEAYKNSTRKNKPTP